MEALDEALTGLNLAEDASVTAVEHAHVAELSVALGDAFRSRRGPAAAVGQSGRLKVERDVA
jgi:hypothetical protein